MNVSPALSVTVLTVADEPLQTPTSTTSRSPAVVLAVVVTARLVLFAPWADSLGGTG